jgi:hypothetical protein
VASDTHVVPDIEDVVERHERYWVVQKRGEAAELAKRLTHVVPKPGGRPIQRPGTSTSARRKFGMGRLG